LLKFGTEFDNVAAGTPQNIDSATQRSKGQRSRSQRISSKNVIGHEQLG